MPGMQPKTERGIIHMVKKKVYYINWRSKWGLETVDEFDDYKEARRCCYDYNLGAPGHYISSRCCKAWREKG